MPATTRLTRELTPLELSRALPDLEAHNANWLSIAGPNEAWMRQALKRLASELNDGWRLITILSSSDPNAPRFIIAKPLPKLPPGWYELELVSIRHAT